MSDSVKLRKLRGILWLVASFILFGIIISIIWMIAVSSNVFFVLLPFAIAGSVACIYCSYFAYCNFVEIGKCIAKEED